MFTKEYGKSKEEKCIFCEERIATTYNVDNFPTCYKCKDKASPNWICACGKSLTILKGKYGVYFNCTNCGNINFKKAKDINTFNKRYKINKALL